MDSKLEYEFYFKQGFFPVFLLLELKLGILSFLILIRIGLFGLHQVEADKKSWFTKKTSDQDCSMSTQPVVQSHRLRFS